MLKRLSILAITVVAAFSLSAQSVDEILNRYFENTGGLDKWRALKTTRMEAKMSMQGMEFPGIIHSKAPNKQRVEVNVQGKQIVQAYDGATAWWINPFMGSPEAQPMPDEMAEEMINEEFENAFIDYQQKGSTVELLGEEEIEGTMTFKVKLTKKNGDVQFYFFDMEYYIPIMMQVTVASGPAKGQMAETYMSDYREVEGLIMPFQIESKVGGQILQSISIQKIELNINMEDSFFAYPKK